MLFDVNVQRLNPSLALIARWVIEGLTAEAAQRPATCNPKVKQGPSGSPITVYSLMGTLQTCILGAQQAPVFIPSPGPCHHVGNDCGLWNAARPLLCFAASVFRTLKSFFLFELAQRTPGRTARDGSNFNLLPRFGRPWEVAWRGRVGSHMRLAGLLPLGGAEGVGAGALSTCFPLFHVVCRRPIFNPAGVCVPEPWSVVGRCR